MQKHLAKFNQFSENLEPKSLDVDDIVREISILKIAIPSLALGLGGTHFGWNVKQMAFALTILEDAFRTDVRPLIAESNLRQNPFLAFREEGYRAQRSQERRMGGATGL
jgi:L-rhamnose isomerase